MNEHPKHSRLGFVVIKLRLDGENYLLLRRDLAWQDVSLIGGHEHPRDRQSLKRAAQRELLEEVPAFRSFKDIDFIPLTEDVSHGPVYSKSAGREVQYTISFFLLRFLADPKSVLESLGPRSPNLLVREKDLLSDHKLKTSELLKRLNEVFSGGIHAIPFSWNADLGNSIRNSRNLALRQREFVLE
ncbi:MAG: NUDIX domain-containing protein [Steroidobacteraceae bacterium]